MRTAAIVVAVLGMACAPASARVRLDALNQAPLSDPADPDIRLLTQLQHKIAAAIARRPPHNVEVPPATR